MTSDVCDVGWVAVFVYRSGTGSLWDRGPDDIHDKQRRKEDRSGFPWSTHTNWVHSSIEIW